MSNQLILKLFSKGNYVGVEKRQPGKDGMIEIMHKNASGSKDTRREWISIDTSWIAYDRFEIVKLDEVE